MNSTESVFVSLGVTVLQLGVTVLQLGVTVRCYSVTVRCYSVYEFVRFGSKWLWHNFFP
jgi:hypothetical protein